MPAVNQVSSFTTNQQRKFIAEARYTHQMDGLVDKTVVNENLPDGQGQTYNWPKYSQWTASALTDGQPISVAQTISTTNVALTPTEVGIMWLLTKKASRTASENVVRAAGQIAGFALKKKLDTDGITGVFQAYSTSLPGTGVTMTAGHISAMVNRIQGNSTEPGGAGAAGDVTCMIHPYQWHPLGTDLMGLGAGGANFYPVPAGLSADLLASNTIAKVAGANVVKNPNIVVDGSSDGKGAVYGKNSGLLVWFTKFNEESEHDITLRGDVTVITSDYAYGVLNDNWGFVAYSAAATPAS